MHVIKIQRSVVKQGNACIALKWLGPIFLSVYLFYFIQFASFRQFYVAHREITRNKVELLV